MKLTGAPESWEDPMIALAAYLNTDGNKKPSPTFIGEGFIFIKLRAWQ
jgi:hypothetical protein